ncbi:hypothetical protein Taro_029733 [Colocasia esculenta]|uniref:Uncharacterized protein n=1 Tax=Colocasia esculenta TaxID=4460 RepID=A0A843VKJ7_COLES|nr:hypothetical protein [Colocasia esculenta]
MHKGKHQWDLEGQYPKKDNTWLTFPLHLHQHTSPCISISRSVSRQWRSGHLVLVGRGQGFRA